MPLKRTAVAFDLAERYRDFRALVKLCNHGTAESASQNAYFLEKYKKDYAFALYTWYLDSNQHHKIVTQNPAYGGYVGEFLDNKHLHRLSWLQSVSTDSYGKASTSLLQEAQSEVYLAQQKVGLVPACSFAQADTICSSCSASANCQRWLVSVDSKWILHP